MRIVILIIALLGVVAGAVYWFIFREDVDWRQAALDDIDFMYQALVDGHPGPVDAQNPAFLNTLEDARRVAISRAQQVETAAGHFYTKRGFTVAFEDVHVADQLYVRPERNRLWPGFATVLNAQGVLEVYRRDTQGTPPLGARLVSCDGHSQSELAQSLIYPFFHASWLNAKRGGDLPYIFIDSDNPFVTHPASCLFDHEGEVQAYNLDWLPASDPLIRELLEQFDPVVSVESGLRFTSSGMAWVSVASFNDSDSEIGQTLDALNADLAANAEDLSVASAIVLDVRGNGGGSTASGQRLANMIWGEDFVEAHRPVYSQTEWRSSEFTLGLVEGFVEQLTAALGEEAALVGEVRALRDGIAQSVSEGEDFYIQPEPQRAVMEAVSNRSNIPVYLITEHTCVSACLDFVDLILAMPQSVHVGGQTGGDTRYLEVVFADLPSRTGRIAFPAAIHRDRERGDNVSYTPAHAFDGNLGDTDAIEAWLEVLHAELNAG